MFVHDPEIYSTLCRPEMAARRHTVYATLRTKPCAAAASAGTRRRRRRRRRAPTRRQTGTTTPLGRLVARIESQRRPAPYTPVSASRRRVCDGCYAVDAGSAVCAVLCGGKCMSRAPYHDMIRRLVGIWAVVHPLQRWQRHGRIHLPITLLPATGTHAVHHLCVTGAFRI